MHTEPTCQSVDALIDVQGDFVCGIIHNSDASKETNREAVTMQASDGSGLDEGGSSGVGESSSSSEYILKVEPVGLVMWGLQEKYQGEVQDFWPGLLEEGSCHNLKSGRLSD